MVQNLSRKANAQGTKVQQESTTATKGIGVNILSSGLGTQSTALVVMAIRGQIQVDHIIFADTGFEPQSVYDQLELTKKFVNGRIPIHVVNSGNIKEDTLKSVASGERSASMPFFTDTGMVMRQCTDEYKIRPVRRKIRELMSESNIKKVNLMLGISIDEIERAKPSNVKYIKHIFPLLDARMYREDCAKLCQEERFPPIKSACICCPFRGNISWLEMKKNNPEEFAQACDFDKQIRNMPRLKQKTYLHKSRQDLDKAIEIQDSNFAHEMWAEECTGNCGL